MNYKPVFDMSPTELVAHLKAATEKVVRETFDNGLPVSYQNKRCLTSSHYIHEYKNGRKQLVHFDTTTRRITLLTELQNV